MKQGISRKIIQICLCAFFFFVVIIPLMTMLLHITAQGFDEVIHSVQFGKTVYNSLITSSVASLLSIILGLAAAWCTERTAIKGKAIWNMVFMLPMLIPSISHAFGLIALFGSNGFITRMLNLEGGIYGYTGIILGFLMYAFPVAYIMFASILRYEDGLPYQAAKVLGIPFWYSLRDITFPYLRKTFITVFFAIFTMIITDYGVPLTVGGKDITLSVLMYNKAVGLIDYGAGSVVGMLLLLPAIVAFVVDMNSKNNSQGTFVTDTVQIQSSGFSKMVSYLYCGLVTLFVIAPILSFCMMVLAQKYPVNMSFSTYHIYATLNRGAFGYLQNSVMYSALAATLGTIVSFICAYVTSRMNGSISKFLHLICLTTMAIPGIVLGLAYVMSFNGTFIYGTMIIVVMVNMVHFFASPYLMMYNSLNKLNPNIEAVGATLGIGRGRIIWNVIIPKIKGTMYEMFTYYFVNGMMTISAVSFLAPPSPKPLALLINQFEAQMLMESAAFVSILILAVNCLMKIVMGLMERQRSCV